MFFVWLGVFAIVGVSLRYMASVYVLHASFPAATLLVNILGSFVAGILYSYQLKNAEAMSPLVIALGVGLLGALTTFSSFSLETVKLFQSNGIGLAALNVLLSNGLSIGFCYAGVRIYS